MIAIIDYGVGNLYSLAGSFKFLGLDSIVTSDKNVIDSASHIVLPGVGAFGAAADKLCGAGLDTVVKTQAAKGKPVLGVCLGMQLLFDKSYEYGVHEGLGLIGGNICPLAPDIAAGLKVPHMGWNSLELIKPSRLLKYTASGEYVYYVHSYYAVGCGGAVTAVSDYSVKVTGAVENGNVFGAQFHPEKSGETGLKMLKAFGEIK